MNFDQLTESALDTLAAEYALGTQTLRVRRHLERYAQRRPSFAQRIERWQLSLSPLAEGLAPIEPPERVWKGVEARLGFARSMAQRGATDLAVNQITKTKARAAAGENESWWHRLQVWRNLTFTMSAVAGLLAFIVVLPGGISGLFNPNIEPDCYFLMTGNDMVPRYAVTEFHQRNELIVAPIEKQAANDGKSLVLWAVVGDATVAVGEVRPDQSTKLKMSPRVKSALYAKGAKMAVSIEAASAKELAKPAGPIKCIGDVLMTGKGMKNSPPPFV
jgi:anti-sigma-K factor RskA